MCSENTVSVEFRSALGCQSWTDSVQPLSSCTAGMLSMVLVTVSPVLSCVEYVPETFDRRYNPEAPRSTEDPEEETAWTGALSIGTIVTIMES